MAQTGRGRHNSTSANGDPLRSFVLELCRRVGEKLTLRKIVQMVLEKRPDLRLQFPEIWAGLVKAKCIAFIHDGKQRHYCVLKKTPHRK
jgi:hypothetical protein